MPDQVVPSDAHLSGRLSAADTPLAGLLRLLADVPDGDTVAQAICQGVLAAFAPRVTTIHLARPQDQVLILEGQYGFDAEMARLYGSLPMDVNLPASAAYRLNSAVLVPIAGASDDYPLIAAYARSMSGVPEQDGDGQIAFFPLRCRSLPIGVLGLEFGQPIDNWHLRSEVEPILSSVALWAAIILRPVDLALRGGTPRRMTRGLEVTGRQRQIITLVSEGLTNAQIGHQLGYSAGTVKAELAVLTVLLGASGRADLVLKADRARL